jgi:SAM-dependent methyltransferase
MSVISDYLITGLSYVSRPAKRMLIRYSYQLSGKKGLEIGGPSAQFSLMGGVPVYLFAEQVDGVNFSNETVWEGSIREGQTYRYHTKTGHQFIKEATDLTGIANDSYDFILSCHSLEHVANPLKAVKEWMRVLKTGGLLILILPDKRFTFDAPRPYTTMEHLLNDLRSGVQEDDTTHFEEILKLNEPGFETSPASPEERELILRNNHQNRRAHHHVFSLELVREMLEYSSCNVLYQKAQKPFHLITVARKM